MVDPAFWKGKRVLVTGHTGFKGGWLSLWLGKLGSRVTGFAQPPSTNPSLYELASVSASAESNFGDIRSAAEVLSCMRSCEPEIVFHLAAQPLVRESYGDPIGTYMTNVMGTAHVLEAARSTSTVKVVVVVTSDKCYEPWDEPAVHRESDPMGGYDPYSSSKGCAELVAAAYRRSFFEAAGIRLATARAGNVIGGGDWAQDRLLPDCVNAILEHRVLRLRSPQAVRPWQHVMDALGGYLVLAEKLSESPAFAGSYNFGPASGDVATVSEVIGRFVRLWGEPAQIETDEVGAQLHETGFLALDSLRARVALGWRPRLRLEEALEFTAAWYRGYSDGLDLRALTLAQIAAFGEKLGDSERRAALA